MSTSATQVILSGHEHECSCYAGMGRHAQRISPVQTTCSVSEASLRIAVLQIAAQHAAAHQQNKERAGVQHSSQQHATMPHEAAGEEDTAPQAGQADASNAEESRPPEALRLRFAIAFRSRMAEPTATGAATLPPVTQKVNFR